MQPGVVFQRREAAEGVSNKVHVSGHLKNQGLILHPPASMMVDALDYPAAGLRAQPLP